MAWAERKKNIARELADLKLREADLALRYASLEGESQTLRVQLAASEQREVEKTKACEALQERCQELERDRAMMAMSTSTAHCQMHEALDRERGLLSAAAEQRLRHGRLEDAQVSTLARAESAEADVTRLGGDLGISLADNAALRRDLEEAQSQNRDFRLVVARLETQRHDLTEDNAMQLEAMRSAAENAAAFASRCETLEEELGAARGASLGAGGALALAAAPAEVLPQTRALTAPPPPAPAAPGGASAAVGAESPPRAMARAGAALHQAAADRAAMAPQGRLDALAMHSLRGLGPLERLPQPSFAHSGCRKDYPRGASTRGIRARILHDVLSSHGGAKPQLPTSTPA